MFVKFYIDARLYYKEPYQTLHERVIMDTAEPIAAAIADTHDLVRRNNEKRDRLISKLEAGVEGLTFGPDDSPRDRETKLQMLGTFDSLLTSTEVAFGRATSLLIKQKKTEQEALAGQVVAQLLTRFSPTTEKTNSGVDPDAPEIDAAIQTAVSQECAPILPGELEAHQVPTPADEEAVA